MKKLSWVLSIALLFSCQTSKITYKWTDENVAPKKYTKILVLGVFKDNDHELQSKMEHHIVGDLNDLGYSAFSASEIYPPNSFINSDTTKAIEAINKKGFDAVLTVVLLNKQKEKNYVPAKTEYVAPYHDQFDRYYSGMYNRIYTEGYYTTETKLFWETNFYDHATKKLIYSSQTRSFNPGSKESLAHYYGLLLVNSLVKSRVLIKPDEPQF